MSVAIVMTMVAAVILFVVVAPSWASWRRAGEQQGHFPTRYDRMIAEFGRRRRAESEPAAQELPSGKRAGGPVSVVSPREHSRSRVSREATLRRRSS
jgi:hypothetical protein